MAGRFCPSCQRVVAPIKKFNWAAFFFWCLTGIGGLIYVIWYWIKPKNRCPICNMKV